MNYTENPKNININTSRLSGFDIQNAFKALSFYFPCASIFAESSNIAGATDEYLINRSQSQLAEIANVSLRTAARQCKMAQELNMVEVHAVYDKKTRARLANVYRLTAKFLRFANALKAEIKPKRLSIGNHVKAVKLIIAKLLIKITFKPSPPMPNVHTPPCQNGTANNKYNSLEVRETETGAINNEADNSPQLNNTNAPNSVTAPAPMDNHFVRACLAKGKAQRDNDRKLATRDQLRKTTSAIQDKAIKLAQRMSWHNKPKADKKIDQCFKADHSDVDYSAPAGFRTI
ncbi:hypothetical protein [Rosenbergiella collisarenosi]|uniref:hypothetical protein n=1 Tax=Rosenbergiella collisarenosi TaxID=1544695 RepID=UPI001F4DEF4E|nr:hypothetical protein [Rosenbergiella collisarenosi]